MTELGHEARKLFFVFLNRHYRSGHVCNFSGSESSSVYYIYYSWSLKVFKGESVVLGEFDINKCNSGASNINEGVSSDGSISN